MGQPGAPDGFNADAAVHIPLPQHLGKIQSIMERTGFGAQLELCLTRAAAMAIGRTGELLVSAIDNMTLENAMGIYRGPDDEATQYFSRKMSNSLAAEMCPIVEESLNDVGAAKALARVIDQYHALPLSREVDTDLTSHVVEKGLDGIFHSMAQQEAAIRHDPPKNSSDMLRRLFEN